MRRSTAILAATLTALYLLLSLQSVVCSSDHPVQPPKGHLHAPSGPHHMPVSSHSHACAWACQANPTSVPSLHDPLGVPFPLVTVQVAGRPELSPDGVYRQPSARAPPRLG